MWAKSWNKIGCFDEISIKDISTTRKYFFIQSKINGDLELAIASAFEPNLYEDAFVKDVIIVTPSTLLAALKLVDNLWKNDKQKRFAIEIATEAGKLYDSFTNLTDELLKIGNQIGTVQNTYQSTMKKLTGRGNLIKRVEKLKSLGAKASKSIDDKLLKRALDDDFEELN